MKLNWNFHGVGVGVGFKNIKQHTCLPAHVQRFLFLPHFVATYDLLLKRHTASWNLFVYLTNLGTMILISWNILD